MKLRSLPLLCLVALSSACTVSQEKANRRLVQAIENDDLGRATTALERANIEAPTRFGVTPLHIAVRQKKPEMVRLLLDAGANPDSKDENGYPPLSVVMDLEIARMLLDAGANTCRIFLLQKIIVTDRSRILITPAEAAELRQIIHLVQWRRRRC